MGQKYLLDGASFTNTAYKIIRDDAALNPGSLFLFDPTHSLTQLSGVPANGAALYNLAWAEAAAVLGAGDVSSLRGSFRNDLTINTQYKAERTAKGGLHLLVTQTSLGSQAWIELPTAVRARLLALPTRAYILFVWTRTTRVSTSNNNMREVAMTNNASAASNALFLGAISNTLGLGRYSQSAPTGWAGSPNGIDGLNTMWPLIWGNAPAYTGLNSTNSKSHICYRVHLVDVAASGKTAAQLDAEDLALYNSLFGSGGRLNGDSWALTTSDLA